MMQKLRALKLRALKMAALLSVVFTMTGCNLDFSLGGFVCLPFLIADCDK